MTIPLVCGQPVPRLEELQEVANMAVNTIKRPIINFCLILLQLNDSAKIPFIAIIAYFC